MTLRNFALVKALLLLYEHRIQLYFSFIQEEILY